MSHRDETNQNLTDPDDFERRLNAKLKEHQERHAPKKASAWGLGVRYGAEFAGGVLVGAGLGYVIDLITGWTPLMLFVGVIMGFAAGTLNVVRAAQSMSESDDSSQ